MAAHLYWRLNVTSIANPPTGAVKIAELQFYDASGSALATGGTASASTTGGGTTAAQAFDANFSTYWQSTTIPAWLRYQFASAVDVRTVRLIWGDIWPYAPKDFTIDYSDDGSSWTTAGTFSVTFNSSLLPGYSVAIGTPASGYVNLRIEVTGTQNGANAVCGELQIRETTGGATVTSGVVQYAFTNSSATSNPADKAFDSNNATFWSGDTPSSNWFGQAFARAIVPAEITYQASGSTAFASCPNGMKLSGSNDGANWTVIATLTPATWTSGSQIQTFAITAAAGRFRTHPGMEAMRPPMYGGMNA